MFCYKCGAQIADDARFCLKCGTKVPDGSVNQQDEQSTYTKQEYTRPVCAQPIRQSSDAAEKEPEKRKFRKLPIILGAAALVTAAAVFFVIRFWNGFANYVDTVKAPLPTEKPTQGDKPLPTEKPTQGDKPLPTEKPTQGDKPLPTEKPTQGDKPLPTEKPTQGDKPLPTEKPTQGDKPLPTEIPAQENTGDTSSGRMEYTDEQIYAAYQDILDLFYEGLANQWASYDPGQVSAGMGLSYLWYLYREGSLTDAGYQFMDLNGDGMPELLVSLLRDSWGSGDGMIYDLYTYRDGKTVHLLSGGERDCYYLCRDGVIANEGSGGAAYSVYDFYEVGWDLLLKDRIVYDGSRDEKNPWFHETADGMIPMKEEEALQFINSYEHLPYELMPFTEYVPAQEPDNGGGQTAPGRRILPSDGYAEGGTGDVMGTWFFDYTVNSAYRCGRYAGRAAARGCELLVVEITVKNTCDMEIEMYDTDFQLQWEDDADDAYRFSLTAYDEELDGAVLPAEYTLKPGAGKTGLLVFEVPVGYREFSVSYLEAFDDGTTGDIFFVYFTPGGITL